MFWWSQENTQLHGYQNDDAFKSQYKKYLERMINNSFSVYLLLQDRIEESLDLYEIVKLDENENGN